MNIQERLEKLESIIGPIKKGSNLYKAIMQRLHEIGETVICKTCTTEVPIRYAREHFIRKGHYTCVECTIKELEE